MTAPITPDRRRIYELDDYDPAKPSLDTYIVTDRADDCRSKRRSLCSLLDIPTNLAIVANDVWITPQNPLRATIVIMSISLSVPAGDDGSADVQLNDGVTDYTVASLSMGALSSNLDSVTPVTVFVPCGWQYRIKDTSTGLAAVVMARLVEQPML